MRRPLNTGEDPSDGANVDRLCLVVGWALSRGNLPGSQHRRISEAEFCHEYFGLRAFRGKQMASTAMNIASSRSHTVPPGLIRTES